MEGDEDENNQGVEITRSSDDKVATAIINDRHVVAIDESEENIIGNGLAPLPKDYLLVATAGCQEEVLAQCFEKARIRDYDIHVSAERSRHRMSGESPGPYPDHMANRTEQISMEIAVETTPEFEDRVQRCLEVAEGACIVSRSVEDGIDFNVEKTLSVR